MSFSLIIWKWRSYWPFRFERWTRDQLLEDIAPFSTTRFDAKSFAAEIQARFGSDDYAVYGIDIMDFTGCRANWIILAASSATVEQLEELAGMCDARGLHICSC